MSDEQNFPPPDIARDRICVVLGGSLIQPPTTPGEPGPFRVVEGDHWLSIVPLESSWAHPDGKPVYPSWPTFRVSHMLYVGTVDEILDEYRAQLTAAFNIYAVKRADGTYGVNPWSGAASLAPLQERLAAAGIAGFTQSPCDDEAGAEALDRLYARRDEMDGVASPLPGRRYDLLARLVAAWTDTPGLTCPPVAAIDRMIADLRAIRADVAARRGEG